MGALWKRKRRSTWAMLIMCGLLFVVWGLSVRFGIIWGTQKIADDAAVAATQPGMASSHQFGFAIGSAMLAAGRAEQHPDLQFTISEGFRIGPNPMYSYSHGPVEVLGLRWPIYESGRIGFMIAVPLWVPCLLAVLVALICWQRDRHVPVGSCQKCTYDLRGNVSGRWPECGVGVNCDDRQR